MRVHRVFPRGIRVTEEVPDQVLLAVAEAVRAAILPYVSLTQAHVVEQMDLREIVVKAARAQRVVAPQYGKGE